MFRFIVLYLNVLMCMKMITYYVNIDLVLVLLSTVLWRLLFIYYQLSVFLVELVLANLGFISFNETMFYLIIGTTLE